MSLKSFAQGSVFPPTKQGVLRLYNMRFCPFAQRTRLVLLHKNIPHEVVNVHLKSKPDWFLELNPLGQVPVLQIDDKVVPESTATCEWLDDVYPENRLTPVDPYRRAWDRVLTEYISKVRRSKPCMFDFLLWPFFERFPMLAVLKENPGMLDLEAGKFPTLSAWDKAMRKLPAVMATSFDAQSHATWFKGHLSGAPDYDMYLKED
ncbi:omega class glutathione-s-transferase [Elysia marginata]|uniref:Glutathione S-transferase omega n=1 Tax=Elysia marginata TaxID=1093978 RepID=A0AAV4FB76_9GAST|nr:omega class glutathione-s-transferase [Elysia marginata]